MHGSADRCWPYQGGVQTCIGLQDPSGFGSFVPITSTVSSWASRNGCQPTPIVENLPDADPGDGTTVTRLTYQGCAKGGDVELLRINGGGHTWPGGSSVLPPATLGRVSREFNASKVMWDFFKAHPMM
jgi:polyhydroxybutyrate depolymerase